MNVLLGVCGGIAVYKIAELVRLLRKQNIEVRVVMTASAQEFVSTLTFQALSGHKVHTELLDCDTEQAMGHIELARWADLFLLAPATANMIAKLAHGLADDLLSTLYLAVTCPVYLAPAMNQAMWHKKSLQENIAILRQHGLEIIEPTYGEQACGDVGVGRLAEPHTICSRILRALHSKMPLCLCDVPVLISAGATREPLDPVRYLTNRSSGKMGYALAQAAVKAGAKVTLVSGVVNLPAPTNVKRVTVETAIEMYHAVLHHAEHHAIYIGAAAVADYRPQKQAEKIKKQDDQLVIVLEKNPDILTAVAELKTLFTVGFAAETENLEHYALDKLQRKQLNMIAANWVGQEQGGFDSDENALHVFWQNGQQQLAMTNKIELAEQLIQLIAQQFQKWTAKPNE